MGQARCGIGRVCEAGVVAGAGDSAPGSPSVVRRAGHPHVVGGGLWAGEESPHTSWYSSGDGHMAQTPQEGPLCWVEAPHKGNPGPGSHRGRDLCLGCCAPVQKEGTAWRAHNCGYTAHFKHK